MNLLEKVNIIKMYLKNVKKSILFTGRVCVFALKETKEAICHIGRIILYAFLVIFDAVCYAAKKTAGFAEKIAVKVKELILFIGRKITVIAVKIADVVQKAALKIKDAMHPVSRTDIFILAALLLVIITPIIINLFFKLNVKIRQVNLYVSVRSEELFGKELMEKLIREFEEKNPEINLKFAGNSSAAEPDVLFFSENDFGALAAGGSLMELNSFTNYDSGARQMAIPLVSFMDMLFYNIDILSAAGFSRPPKTRDEFINYAKTISRGDFQAAGYALSLSQKDRQALSRDVFSWIWASGGSLFSMNEDGAIVLTRAAKNDLSFFDTLNKEGTLAPNIFETTGDERLEAFVQGKTAMMIASTGVIPYLRAKMGDSKFGVTTIPVSAASGKYTISLSSIYAGISANSAYKEEAWNFLAFLASKSNVLCEKLNAVPGLVSNIIPGDYVKDDPFYSKAWDIFEASAVTESISAKPEAQEYENILLEELKPILEKN